MRAPTTEGVVSGHHLLGGEGQELALEAVGHHLAGASGQELREGADVAPQHRQDDVGAPGAARVRRVLVDELYVSKHPKQAEERERRHPMRRVWGSVQRLEHLGAADSVQLVAEFERDERVEVGVAAHLAGDGPEQREIEAVGDPPDAEHAIGHLQKGAEGVAQDEERLLRGVLRELLADELAPERVLREHGLEVAGEDIGTVVLAQELPDPSDGLRERVANDAQLLPKVVGHGGFAPGAPGMVPRIAEAGEAFEEHLQGEERLLLTLECQVGVPPITRAGLLAAHASSVAQEVGVDVA